MSAAAWVPPQPLSIDSNETGLSFAEETTPKVLPETPTWYGLEPNTYTKFGATYGSVARIPITSDRQQRKGTITDLTVGGGFQTDFTQNNLTRLLQGFFFADIKEKPSSAALNAAPYGATNTFPYAFPVTAVDGRGNYTCDAGPKNATGTQASGTLTMLVIPTAANTINIGGMLFTWVSTLPISLNQIQIAGTLAGCFDNMVDAFLLMQFNMSIAGYADNWQYISFSGLSPTLTITFSAANGAQTAGNAFALAASNHTSILPSNTTLLGGVDGISPADYPLSEAPYDGGDSLFFARGFSELANNGLIVGNVITNPDPTREKSILATTNATVMETPPSTATLDIVGFQFPANGISLTANANNVVLNSIGGTAATGVVNIGAEPTALDTFTLNGRVFTWVAGAPANNYQVERDVLEATCATNLAAQIAAAKAAGDSALQYLTAVASGANVDITSTYPSGQATLGNLITMASSNLAAVNVTGYTLSGGANSIDFTQLGLTLGEWLFIGGDTVLSQFAGNAPGYARIGAITPSTLTLDITSWIPANDDGSTAGQSVQIFYGSVLVNASSLAGIITRTYAIERTLGNDSNGPQAEYLQGCVANEFALELKDASKITTELTFVGMEYEGNDGLTGLLPGTRVPALGESAFNTSQDIYAIRLAVANDPAAPVLDATPLFGYCTDAKINIKNNAVANRALAVLGAISINTGFFTVEGTVTAYFDSVDAVNAIRNNADMCLSAILARANAGWVLDIPLLQLGGGENKVEKDKPIMVDLTQSAGKNAAGYTFLMNSFKYLPNAAMPNNG